MAGTKTALESLNAQISNRGKGPPISFDEFLGFVRNRPKQVLRSIFQLFGDMVASYVGHGVDEHPGNPAFASLVRYDCSKLLADGCDRPFCADRLFANRFVRLVESFKVGAQQNKLYIFEGLPGCGKSTFLNNLLGQFEAYTGTEDGKSFEVIWDITIKETGTMEVPCPSHDHPILVIPKQYRADFLRELLSDNPPEVIGEIFSRKEYEWVFKEEACTICKSIFWALFDRHSLEEVLRMVRVRPYRFDRRLSQGISVFNPGDKPVRNIVLKDDAIQQALDGVFGVNVVKYIYSPSAATNNGVYVLMDIKGDNYGRLLELHNVISEGVHKVGDVEERVRSIFIALMNPEDKEKLAGEKEAKSFQARIQYVTVPYILDVSAEVAVYRSTFGVSIDSRFRPGVLENFARIIISSRVKKDSPALKGWLKDVTKYKKYCDTEGLLLRMAIYADRMPAWLSDEDKKTLTPELKRDIIEEYGRDGNMGFTGRESVDFMGEFLGYCQSRPGLITMNQVAGFFSHRMDKERTPLPAGIVTSLVSWYDYEVLSHMKESLFFYNKQKIAEDVLHYLWAVNFDVGATTICPFTGKELEVTLEFLRLVGSYLTGTQLGDAGVLDVARKTQRRYSEVIAQNPPEDLQKTDLYSELTESYARNIKENALAPFVKNEKFKEAVKAFGTDKFETFDTRIQEHVTYMMGNLVSKFGYTEQGARETCIYALDKNLS